MPAVLGISFSATTKGVLDKPVVCMCTTFVSY